MKRFTGLFALVMMFGVAEAQQVRNNAPQTPLEPLADEFTSESSLPNWQKLHGDKIKNFSVSNGQLKIETFATGWYGDYQGPFVFKTVAGDFDVRARIKVSGQNDTLPQSAWSLAGLMVRQATNGDWQPRQENWLFLTTGIAEPKGVAMFEAKTTNNSISNLKLRPAKAGWVELRIVRLQASFILMYRYNATESWTVLERFYRPLLPQELQVGINAYSGWNEIPQSVKADPKIFNSSLLKDVTADMIVETDYIRFTRPAVNMDKLRALRNAGFNAPYYTAGNLLTDYSVSNEEVIAILGN